MSKLTSLLLRHQTLLLYVLLFSNLAFFVLIMTPGKICLAVNVMLGSNQITLGAGTLIIAIIAIVEICRKPGQTLRKLFIVLAIVSLVELGFISIISLVPSEMFYEMRPKGVTEPKTLY